jgi:ribosomal protein S2
VPSKVFKNHYFFNGPWVPGFLSNFRNMRLKGSFFFKQSYFPNQYHRTIKTSTVIRMASMGLSNLPNLLYISNAFHYNRSSVKEAFHLQMPTITPILPDTKKYTSVVAVSTVFDVLYSFANTISYFWSGPLSNVNRNISQD